MLCEICYGDWRVLKYWSSGRHARPILLLWTCSSEFHFVHLFLKRLLLKPPPIVSFLFYPFHWLPSPFSFTRYVSPFLSHLCVYFFKRLCVMISSVPRFVSFFIQTHCNPSTVLLPPLGLLIFYINHGLAYRFLHINIYLRKLPNVLSIYVLQNKLYLQ